MTMIKLSCFGRLSYETDSQVVIDFIYFSADTFFFLNYYVTSFKRMRKYSYI